MTNLRAAVPFTFLLAFTFVTADAQDPELIKPVVVWTVEIDSPSFGGAAVADVDDDGRLEVAFGTYFGDDSVRVLNGEDGSQLWRYDAGNACLDASLRFADIDGDKDLELIVPVSNKGQVLAFQAESGEQIWNYQPSPVECTDSPPTIIDVDQDGKLDFVYGTFLGNLHVVRADSGKKNQIYKVSDEFIQTAPTVADLNKDGVLDFVCAVFKGKNNVYAIDGKSGGKIWTYYVPGEHIGMYHGCSIGDLDGDGNKELVIGAYDGKVHCINATSGEKIWEATAGDRYIMSPTVIADLDGDGKSEVIIASEKVTVMSPSGKIIWSERCVNSQPDWDSVTRGASVADLNGDGKLDVATLSGQGIFQVRDGISGKLICEFNAAKENDFNSISASHGVTIADLTGDNKLDVFFVIGRTQPERKGLAVCLTGFAGTGRGWFMLRHDIQGTGNLATKLSPVLLEHIEGISPKK